MASCRLRLCYSGPLCVAQAAVHTRLQPRVDDRSRAKSVHHVRLCCVASQPPGHLLYHSEVSQPQLAHQALPQSPGRAREIDPAVLQSSIANTALRATPCPGCGQTICEVRSCTRRSAVVDVRGKTPIHSQRNGSARTLHTNAT